MPTYASEVRANKNFVGNVVVRFLGEYFAIREPDSGLILKNRFKDILAGVVVNPTSVDPRRITSSITTHSISMVDKQRAITKLVGERGAALVGQEVEIWIGRSEVGMDFADYYPLAKTKIDKISLQDNRYTFSAVEETDRMQRPTFDTTTRLVGNIAAGTTTIVMKEDISDFPSSGFLMIDNEYMSYSSKNNGTKTFSGIARGEFGTTPEAHVIDSNVYLADRIQDNPINILLRLLTSGGGGGSYDDLDSGLAIDQTLIDISDIENLRDDVFAGKQMRLVLANIPNTLKFIEDEILVPNQLRFTLSANSKITLTVLDRARFVEFSDAVDNQAIVRSPTWNVDQNQIVNYLDLEWDFDEGLQLYRSRGIFTDDASISTYGKRPLALKFKGVRANLSGDSLVQDFATSLLERLGEPSPVIDVETHISKSLLNVGDKTLFETTTVPTERGDLNFSDELEVLSRAINHVTGVVKFKLAFTSFTGIRSCYLAPSDSVVSVTSQKIIDIGAGRGAFWEAGFKVRLWNKTTREYESDPVNEIASISGDQITFVSDWATTLSTAHKIKFPDYDDATSRQKRYCFISNQGLPFSDGLKTYSITP